MDVCSALLSPGARMLDTAPAAHGEYSPRRPQASPGVGLVSDHQHRLQLVYMIDASRASTARGAPWSRRWPKRSSPPASSTTGSREFAVVLVVRDGRAQYTCIVERPRSSRRRTRFIGGPAGYASATSSGFHICVCFAMVAASMKSLCELFYAATCRGRFSGNLP